MNLTDLSKELLSKDPRIKSIGILKDGKTELNFNESKENRDNNSIKLSFDQTQHIVENAQRLVKDLGKLKHIVFEYQNAKLFNIPVNDEIISLETSKETNNEEFYKTISKNISPLEKDKENENKEQPITDSSQEDIWQNYLLNYIEFWKEFVITSIRVNERIVMSFWRNFIDNKKDTDIT